MNIPEFCINEQIGKEECQTQNLNHRHLPYSIWHIITDNNNDYLTHLLKIGLDVNKRDFKSLMEHFEDVNFRGTKWIPLLQTRRGLVCQMKEE